MSVRRRYEMRIPPLIAIALLLTLWPQVTSGFFATDGVWETEADKQGCLLMSPLLDFVDGDRLIVSATSRFIHLHDEALARNLQVEPHELGFELILAHPFQENLNIRHMEAPTGAVVDGVAFQPRWEPDTWGVQLGPPTSSELLKRLTSGSSIDLGVSTENHNFAWRVASHSYEGFEGALAEFDSCRSSR